MGAILLVLSCFNYILLFLVIQVIVLDGRSICRVMVLF